ncbi:hypothetical protein [Nocardiopsis salina]|uniref:hypothetical protein n=1 Tax=Nocardiopsis salina TaxID=245836 RepID=UPI000344E954|nr:hypothetical protein [Nocardiopsis salina]
MQPTPCTSYPDANSTPWPLNHHAYIHMCVRRLAKELVHPPHLYLPECHVQRHDVRSALVRVPRTQSERGLLLCWDEQRGWGRIGPAGRRPLALGAEPVLAPDTFALAVTSLLQEPSTATVVVVDRSRKSSHPVDPGFERALAAYRRGEKA